MSIKHMYPSPFASTAVGFLLFLTAVPGPWAAQHNNPNIDTAVVTTTTQPNQIAIRGSGFGNIQPTVTLDGVPLGLASYTDTMVVAYLPDDATAHPGTYRLSLTNNIWHGDSGQQTATMDVTLGAVGPAGLAGAAGPQGPPGQPGPPGPAGAQGLPGAPGPQGPAGLNWKGAWNSTTIYAPNDAVQFNGSSYVAGVKAAQGLQPDTNPATWNLLAQQGVPGAAGLQGPAGSAGPPGPAGATGPSGPAGPQGTQGRLGATGPMGPQGPQGPGGVSGYVVAACNYAIPAGGVYSSQCDCPSGKKALSGGFSALDKVNIGLAGSYPTADQGGWVFDFLSRSAYLGGSVSTMYVVCATAQ